MIRGLEQMVDSSAIGFLSLVSGIEEQGRGRKCPNPYSSDYISLNSWYNAGTGWAEEPLRDCPYWLYRWSN